MRVLAVDPATQSGWAAGDGDSFERRSVDSGAFRMPKRPTLGERLVIFSDTLRELIEHFKPDLIAYEKPYWPQPKDAQSLLPRLKAALASPNPKAIIAGLVKEIEEDGGPQISVENLQFLQKVEGILIHTATSTPLPGGNGAPTPYEAYASSSWRVTALGYGRAPKGSPPGFLKKAMVARAKQLGYPVGSEDQADAIGILMHALHGAPANARAQFDLLDHAGADL